MASALARAGHQVNAYDLDPARALSLAGEGVKPAGSIAEVAADADAHAIMVATPAQGESVLFGDGRAAQALRPGRVVLVMSTVGRPPSPAGPNASPLKAPNWSTHRYPAVSPAPAPGTCWS